MKDKVVVSIDLGTTGNRVIAFCRNGKVAAKAYYEFPQIFPKSGWVEHNPHDILDTTIKALNEVLDIVGADSVVSIGIANQRESVVLWDKASGESVYNAIVWQCRRTQKLCRELLPHKDFIKKKTGLFVDPYFSATKVKWILDNVPKAGKLAAKGQLYFGTIETWVLWNLTGKKVHATEPSNASRTMIFDIHSLKFDEELLELFGIPDHILPEVKSSDSLFGVTDKSITGKEIPISGMLGDQQASLFAHRGWEEGVVKTTYGTGLFTLTGTGNRVCDSPSLVSTIAWKIGNEVSYALEASMFMGGAAIQWLRDNLRIIKDASDTDRIASGINDNEGVYFVPAFQGLGAPYWDSQARGVLVGLTRKSSSENLVRAVLESLAYQVRDALEEIKKVSASDIKLLRVDGGASNNNFLMQFQSSLLGISVERPTLVETTSLGAAALSGLSSGFWSKKDLLRINGKDRRFEPDDNRKTYECYYGKWKEAVKRSLKWEECYASL